LPGGPFLFQPRYDAQLCPHQEAFMLKRGIFVALSLAMAAPAFAESKAVKDTKDGAADKVDDAKDTLHTDSGAKKAKRHVKKGVRDTKKTARDATEK
jgi:hypothetical protein